MISWAPLSAPSEPLTNQIIIIMETKVIQDYIHVAQFEGIIFEMYKEEREQWRDADNSDFLDMEYDDETLREMAWYAAAETNESMMKYLHQDDHRIIGNFSNILDDYAFYRTGMYHYDRIGIANDKKMLDAMIKRLDAGVDSPRANDDRDYLSSWVFKAFGTFGFRYNFSNALADALYVYEKETALAS